MNKAGATSVVKAAMTAIACSPACHIASTACGTVAASATPPSLSRMTSDDTPMTNTMAAVTVKAITASSLSRWPLPSLASQRLQRATWSGSSRCHRCTFPHCSQTASVSPLRLIGANYR